MGQTSESASISMAQPGHSLFLLILLQNYIIVQESNTIPLIMYEKLKMLTERHATPLNKNSTFFLKKLDSDQG